MSLARSITISVISHGHGDLLHQLLLDLDALDDLEGVRVIVTLNLPHESLHGPAYTRLNVVVQHNSSPKGFGSNHNAAFGLCETPWFVVLNPDLRIFDRSIFSLLLATAHGTPRLGALAPEIRNSSGKLEDSVRQNLTPWSLFMRHVWRDTGTLNVVDSSDQDQQFFWLAGMFLFLDAAAFKGVSGFDEGYFLYCEDYDLCARLYNAGHALSVCHATVAIHNAQRDSRRSRRHLMMHLRSLARVWCSAPFWKILLKR